MVLYSKHFKGTVAQMDPITYTTKVRGASHCTQNCLKHKSAKSACMAERGPAMQGHSCYVATMWAMSVLSAP